MTYAHIPQVGKQLRRLRARLKKTQAQMADLLENLLKPNREAGFAMHQSDISRYELEHNPIDISVLLAYSQLGDIDVGELLKPHYRDWINSQITLRNLTTDKEADDYLRELESEGRLLAFSQFPSAFFQPSSEMPDSPRFQQISAPNYEEFQFYTIDSLLNFLFSPSSRYSFAERKTVLERYLAVFCGNRFKRLYFFSRHAFPVMSRFPNLELLYKKKTLIMLAPIMTRTKGDVFLEICNAELCDTVYDFYMQDVEPLEGNINLLRCGLQAVEHMLSGHSIEEGIALFAEQIKQRTYEHKTILDNFSQDIRKQLAA